MSNKSVNYSHVDLDKEHSRILDRYPHGLYKSVKDDSCHLHVPLVDLALAAGFGKEDEHANEVWIGEVERCPSSSESGQGLTKRRRHF